jgi:hypothetical protein
MPTDPLDQPQPDDEMTLVYPFTCVTSVGGPYDDQAFAAGVQLGSISGALRVGEIAGATRFNFTVPTTLVDQLELVGMAYGYPVMLRSAVVATDEHEAMPEWTFVEFQAAGAADR